MITELIHFEPEICICYGNWLEFKRENLYLRVPPKEVGKRSSVTFLFSGLFRSPFGHFFWCFCHFFRRFFAKLLDKLAGTTPLEITQCGTLQVALQVQFWPRQRIADFDRKSLPADGALSFPMLETRSELMVIWKGWFETAPCRATLATPFPALCPRILGTRPTKYGLRMVWGELMVIWRRWFETVPGRASLNTPFSALCPRILGTRFTNYGLRLGGPT